MRSRGELRHIVKRALSQPVSNPGAPPLPETPPVLPLQAPSSSFLSSFFFFLFQEVYLFIFLMTDCHPS